MPGQVALKDLLLSLQRAHNACTGTDVTALKDLLVFLQRALYQVFLITALLCRKQDFSMVFICEQGLFFFDGKCHLLNLEGQKK